MLSPAEIEQFGVRLVQDAITEADAAQWRKRAEQFEMFKPGAQQAEGCTPEERDRLRAKWHRCHVTAQACRNKAAFIEWCRRDDVQASLRWESVADQLAVDILIWEQAKAGRPARDLIGAGAP